MEELYMPVQPGGVSKSKRIDALRRVLEKWGSLDKSEINRHVAAFLGVDETALERALYRDLEELVHNGEVVDHRYHADGSLIEDYDPEEHKNTRCRWTLTKDEYEVLGEKALSDLGGSIQASSRIRKAVVLVDATEMPSLSDHLHVYFGVGGVSLCLKVKNDMLPIRIVVGRALDSGSPGSVGLPELEKGLGKRLVVITLPETSVSAVRSAERPGHFLIDANANDLIRVSDLQSKNGTLVRKLRLDEAQFLIKSGVDVTNATRTFSWGHLKEGLEPEARLQGGKSLEMSLPVFIEASSRGRFVVI